MIEKIRGGMYRAFDAFCRLNEKDTETVLYILMCALTIPAAAGFLIYLWTVDFVLPADFEGCLFRQVLHIYCPGCGGTRAVLNLFQGRFLAAFYYHPGAAYAVILYVVFFLSQTLKRLTGGKVGGMRFRMGYLWVMAALVVINFVGRNVLLLGFHMPSL